ncbi:LppX_LprAFG lipoprotein [Nocardioides sp. JQ2195]|uniref:LppX_LprAFG lipoprotein n=1 Tax=Nocardioides sp. JQ2195 TaxID=2592334 RepID=UPI00143E2DA5|nr:LppX_LprAFG lipoprotein [Nocardioides sp. JQ2195]QIX27056.1 LppX_LprAFG lipoprotein [Nocardioides sp. JQ2195]
MRLTDRRFRTRLASAAVVPLLALTAAGCGADDDTASGADAPSSSSTPEAGEGSSASGSGSQAAPVGDEVDAEEFATTIKDSFTKVDTASVKMELVNAGLAMTADGKLDYTGDAPKMSMTMSAPAFGEQAIKARVVDGKMYMAMPMLGSGTSDTFFQIDLDDPENPLAQSMGGLSSFDPKSTVEMFGQGIEKVTMVGDDSVNGVHTQHYVVTTNTEEFAKSLGDDADLVPKDLTYDVWLDDEGRMAKMEAELDAQGSMTLTMSDWGEPVNIVAPPANKIQDFPSGTPSP